MDLTSVEWDGTLRSLGLIQERLDRNLEEVRRKMDQETDLNGDIVSADTAEQVLIAFGRGLHHQLIYVIWRCGELYEELATGALVLEDEDDLAKSDADEAVGLVIDTCRKCAHTLRQYCHLGSSVVARLLEETDCAFEKAFIAPWPPESRLFSAFCMVIERALSCKLHFHSPAQRLSVLQCAVKVYHRCPTAFSGRDTLELRLLIVRFARECGNYDMFRYYVDEVFPLTITSFNLRQHSNFCSLTVADEIIEFQHYHRHRDAGRWSFNAPNSLSNIGKKLVGAGVFNMIGTAFYEDSKHNFRLFAFEKPREWFWNPWFSRALENSTIAYSVIRRLEKTTQCNYNLLRYLTDHFVENKPLRKYLLKHGFLKLLLQHLSLRDIGPLGQRSVMEVYTNFVSTLSSAEIAAHVGFSDCSTLAEAANACELRPELRLELSAALSRGSKALQAGVVAALLLPRGIEEVTGLKYDARARSHIRKLLYNDITKRTVMQHKNKLWKELGAIDRLFLLSHFRLPFPWWLTNTILLVLYFFILTCCGWLSGTGVLWIVEMFAVAWRFCFGSSEEVAALPEAMEVFSNNSAIGGEL